MYCIVSPCTRHVLYCMPRYSVVYTTKHKIKWDDGDRDWNVDLVACNKCREWRFIQSGEDADEFLEEDSE